MTDFVAQKLQEYLADDEKYFRECLVIRDHDTASLLPFRLNRGQQILHRVAEKQKRETGKVRILLLKSRRFGGSTYVAGRSYKNTSLRFNRNAFIVGHEEESTNTLFAMPKLFQEKNPIAPATLSSNAKELIFDNKQGTGLKSGYRLATARNLAAGRSQGIHYLHCSEEAFWPVNGAKELLLGLFQCVPDHGHSEIFRESTANGYGNTFQIAVNKAYAEGRYPYYEEGGRVFAWKAPNSDWVLVFIAWFEIEKYSREFESEAVKEEFKLRVEEKVLEPEELIWVESEAKALQKRYNLSLEQLYWREWAIENKCDGDVDLFHQEYPTSVEEAFLAAGSNYFSRDLCDQIESQCEKPLAVGNLKRKVGKVRLVQTKHGNLTIWERVDPRESYFITADSAGGKKEFADTSNKEPDKTNIDVWNRRTGNQAAQWNGHVDYDMISDIIMMLGDMYKTMGKLPIACVESNNHGATVIADLTKENYPQYGNMGDVPGWQTNKRTKPLMCDHFREYARDGVIKINSVETVSEMRTFIEDSGKIGAAPGSNDDRVITAAIASELIIELPRNTKSKGKTVGFTNFKSMRDTEPSYMEYYVE